MPVPLKAPVNTASRDEVANDLVLAASVYADPEVGFRYHIALEHIIVGEASRQETTHPKAGLVPNGCHPDHIGEVDVTKDSPTVNSVMVPGPWIRMPV